MLHKETIKEAETGKSSGIFTIGLVMYCIIVVSLSNLLNNRWDIPYTGYGAYGLFILAGIFVYRVKFLDYQYVLIDNELLFERVVGRREKLVARIKIKNVLAFSVNSQALSYPGTVDKTLHLLLKWHTSDAAVLIAKDNGKVLRIVFQPSEELAELIRKRVHA